MNTFVQVSHWSRAKWEESAKETKHISFFKHSTTRVRIEKSNYNGSRAINKSALLELTVTLFSKNLFICFTFFCQNIFLTICNARICRKLYFIQELFIAYVPRKKLNYIYPQEAVAWRGVQPSLSARLTSAPCSTRNSTISKLSSMQAYIGRMEKKKKI